MKLTREEVYEAEKARMFPPERVLPPVVLNMEDPEDLKLVNGRCKWALGLVPGAENQGLVANKFVEAPPRLADYDDSAWETPDNIRNVVGTGLTFAWYRFTITLPEVVKGLDVAGAQVWFETCADDYGEIWVDCPNFTQDYKPAEAIVDNKLTPVTGYNARSRILVTNIAQPGRRHVIACLAINGPLGQPYGAVFLRYARLELMRDVTRIPAARPEKLKGSS